MSILGELLRGGKIHPEPQTVAGSSLGDLIAANDIRGSGTVEAMAVQRALAAPGNVRTKTAFSQNNFYDESDTDDQTGCIRSVAHAYSQDGGLAVLFGNIAEEGCIVKTAGVDESIWVFEGTARIFESQDEACEGILGGKVRDGDVVVIRYEGPKGGPGMQEMLYPTSYIKSMGLGKTCALLTDGRFSGGTSGLSIGPRLARGSRGRGTGPVGDRRPDSHRHSQSQNRRANRRRRIVCETAKNRRLPPPQPPTSHPPIATGVCRTDDERSARGRAGRGSATKITDVTHRPLGMGCFALLSMTSAGLLLHRVMLSAAKRSRSIPYLDAHA